MNKSVEELIEMVQLPLNQTNHRFIAEMIDIQNCSASEPCNHHHATNECYRYVILVEPALDLLDVIDI